MSKSMAELMTSPDSGLPERTFDICVAGKLVAELTAADEVLVEIETEIEQIKADAREQEGEFKPKRRMAAKPRVVELQEKAKAQGAVVDAIRDRMAEHEIPLLVRAKEPGVWQQFIDAHPARDKDDDRAGYTRDAKFAALACNIDALRDVAGDYIVKYGDDTPTPEMWTWLARTAGRGDLMRLAATIVSLHERGVDVGKSRVDWLETRHAEVD